MLESMSSSKPKTLPPNHPGLKPRWIKLGDEEWISKHPRKVRETQLTRRQKAFPIEATQLARPIGTDCHCNGKSVRMDPKKTRFLVSKIGGYCAKHLQGDEKPWCFVDSECSGRKLSNLAPKLWAPCHAKYTKVPTKVSFKLPKSSGTNGRLSLKILGENGQKSRWFPVSMKKVSPGSWLKITLLVPSALKMVKRIKVKYVANDQRALKWTDTRAQYGGGFVNSFTRNKSIGHRGTNQHKMTLKHVVPRRPGSARIRVSAADAQNVQSLSGVAHLLLNPSLLGVPKDVILMKLNQLKKRISDATEKRAKMTPKEQKAAVMKVIMEMGGGKLGGARKYMPVGIKTKDSVRGESSVTFENVEEDTEHIVLLFKPGYLFNFEYVKSGASDTLTHKRSIMAKKLKHGQMIITLTWGEEPSDLDLYVVAPGRKGDTAVGGDKPGTPHGPSINWMNKGSEKTYPYILLDVDDMDGKGPETTTVHKPVTGAYKIYVDCFSCSEYDPDSLKEFKDSGATVRVFDRLGLRKEFVISEAKGKVGKFWEVADRKCIAAPPVDTKHNKVGFANRDNVWSFDIVNKFAAKHPL
jgi:hypothetical protein